MINTLKRAGSRIYRALLKHGYSEFLGVRPSTLDYRKRRGINTPIEAKAKGIKGKLYLIVYNSAKVKKMSKERKKVMSSIVVGLKDLLLAYVVWHADRVNSPIRFYG